MWGVDRSGNDTTGGVEGRLRRTAYSLLLAPMPTAHLADFRRQRVHRAYNEQHLQPMHHRRRVHNGYKYLMTDLIKMDLWSEKLKNNIIANGGSVHHRIPAEIREKYKTVRWGWSR
jgi:hypothetical protein